MTYSQNIAPTFHATTGDTVYDALCFSERPNAQLLSPPRNPFAIVRHFGAASEELVRATNAPSRVDTLVLNTTTGGRYRGKVGDECVDFALRQGQVSLVPGSSIFDIEYPACNGVLLMMLPQARTAQLLAGLGAGALPLLQCERHERLAQLFVMAEREMAAPGFASDLLVDGLLRAIITILARYTGAPAEAPERVHLAPVKLQRAKDFIEAELGRGICLDEIAKVAGLSPFHFSRVFKLATGETLYTFIGRRRLARARKLLTERELPLAEVALMCGFASQSHFTAAFTKGVGTSPGRYRRQLLD